MEKPRASDQNYILSGQRFGKLLTAVVLPVTIYFMPESSVNLPTVFDRIVYTLRWETFSGLTLFGAIMFVANGRYHSSAINPLAGHDKQLEFRVRALQNTLEQVLLGVFGRVILSTYLENTVQRVIPVLVVYFVIARVIFYYGYNRDPMKRVLGMAMTLTLHFGVYVTILYFFIIDGPLHGYK